MLEEWIKGSYFCQFSVLWTWLTILISLSLLLLSFIITSSIYVSLCKKASNSQAVYKHSKSPHSSSFILFILYWGIIIIIIISSSSSSSSSNY